MLGLLLVLLEWLLDRRVLIGISQLVRLLLFVLMVMSFLDPLEIERLVDRPCLIRLVRIGAGEFVIGCFRTAFITTLRTQTHEHRSWIVTGDWTTGMTPTTILLELQEFWIV